MSLLTDLISHWKLDEASGNATDSHGTNTLTETDGTIASATGKVGNARDFEAGDTEYFTIADNASLSTGDIDFTWAGWVNAESLPTNNNSFYIASKHGTSGNFEYGVLIDNAANVIRFKFNVSNNGTAIVEATANNLGTPSTATWYFVVAWHDASANTINIQVNNGTADSASHTTGVRDGNGGYSIGAFGAGPSAYFDGLIDSVSFWKRVLTSAERTQLYNAGSGLDYEDFTADITSNLVARWKFDEGSGNPQDSSGNGNHGVLEGNAGYTTGKIGSNSLTLDGAGDAVSVEGVDSLSGDMTVSYWAKTTQTSLAVITGFGDNSSLGFQSGININGTGGLEFTTAGSWVGVTNAIDDGEWHHVAVTLSGTSAKGYLDGAYGGFTQTVDALEAYTGTKRIGSFHSNPSTFSYDGEIDDLRIYSRALSPVDIEELYNFVETEGITKYTKLSISNSRINVLANTKLTLVGI